MKGHRMIAVPVMRGTKRWFRCLAIPHRFGRNFLLWGLLATVAAGQAASTQIPKLVPNQSEAQLAKDLHEIDRDVEAMRSAAHVPGASIVIVKDDRVVLLKGYGLANIKDKRPVTPDTLFPIASCTKAFNSALVLFGVDEGKLALEDPPRKYLPYFRLKDPEANEKITIAGLMDHSSGLPRTDMAWGSGRVGTQTSIELLRNAEPTYPFETIGQYSNVLVQAAGESVAAAYGESWSDLLQRKILGPLGMSRSSAKRYSEIDPKSIATGYRVTEGGSVVAEDPFNEEAVLAAGGVKSCARDMANWIRFHLNHGELEGKRLIRAATLDMAYRPWFEYGAGTYSGLGWFINDDRPLPIVWHDGLLAGFQSICVLVPDRHLGFAILTNNSGRGLNYALSARILDRLIGKVDPTSGVAASRANGLYLDPAGAHYVRILHSGPTLFARVDDGSNIRLLQKSRTVWQSWSSKQPSITVTFEKSPFDRVPEKLVAELSGIRVTGSRKPKYRSPITPGELMGRCAAAAGSETWVRGVRSIGGRYEATYASQNVQSIGLCFFGPDRQIAWFERQYASGRPIAFDHSGGTASRQFEVADHFHRVALYGTDVLDDMLCPLPFQEVDWRATYEQISIVGQRILGGRRVLFVLKRPKQGATELDWVDAETFLVHRRELGDWPVVETLADYQTLEGISVPTSITLVDSSSCVTRLKMSELRVLDREPHWAFHPRSWPGYSDEP